MIRGGHVDFTVLGAFEVDVNGNIASWMIPGKLIKGMGGAMDLVAGAKNIIVTMTHADKHGNSKLLQECTLPLTGVNCITRIITDLAVMEVKDGAFHLRERAPGVSVNEIREKTAGKLVAECNSLNSLCGLLAIWRRASCPAALVFCFMTDSSRFRFTLWVNQG